MSETGIKLNLITVAALFILLAIVSTWPLATDPFHLDPASKGNNDPHFNTYIVFWGAHALTTDPLNLHHTNMFHPERNTFTYSDIELSSSLLMLPAIAIWYNPVLTYNLLIWASIIIGGVGFYLLALDLTRSRGAATLGAAVFVFNPAHFGRYLQIQFFADQWLPWSAWALLRWLGGRKAEGQAFGSGVKRIGWALAAALFFCLHALTGSHNTVFGAIFFGAAIVYFTLTRRLWREARFWAGLALMATVAAVILLPIFIPYLDVEKEMAAARVEDMDILRAGSAGPYELLAAGSRFYRWIDTALGWPSAIFSERLRGYLFPGFVALLLGLAAFFRPEGREKKSGEVRWPRYTAWTLDLAAFFTAWAAVSLAVTGGERLYLLMFPLPSPPSWSLAAVAAATTLVRLIRFRRYPHALAVLAMSAGRRLGAAGDRLFWLLLVVFGFVASLGPDAGLYQVLGRLPVLRLIRVPRRFTLLACFALSALVAYGFAAVMKRMRGRMARPAVASAIVLLFAAEALFAPLPVFRFDPEPQPVYRWLGEQEGDFAVVEFPLDPDNYYLSLRQVYSSIYHWKKLVVGYSGYHTEKNKSLQRRLNELFPSGKCLVELRRLGVRYALVLEDRLSQRQRQALRAQRGLKLEKRFGGMSAYRVMPAAGE